MLAGQGYTQILGMIMKRLQPAFIQGTDYRVNSNGNSGLPTTDEKDNNGKNPYDPRGINAFEDYDYHLIYNDEDDLTGFTSHDGSIGYTLNKDSYDGLVTISVHTEKIDFKIALIYENYDIRTNATETDEKGKLIDVVIMMEDGKPFPLGLSISPAKMSSSVGETVQFRAIIQNVDGSTFDCTEVAGWAVSDSAYSIDRGTIVNSIEGKGQVSAIYDMVIAYAEFEFVSLTVSVEPASVTVDYMGNEEIIPYRAYGNYANGTRIDITSECDWTISNWVGSIQGNIYQAVVNSMGDGVVTASFKGKTGESKIKSDAPEIEIVPSTQTINVGSSATFKAIIISTGQEVTNDCIWISDNYTIGQDGIIIGVNSVGSANITVNYNGSIAKGVLSAELPIPVQIPDATSGSGVFFSKDYYCDSTSLLTVDYDMYGMPDRFDAFSINADGSTGSTLATTGGLVSSQGTISFNVNKGQKIRIIISSTDNGTAWQYNIHY